MEEVVLPYGVTKSDLEKAGDALARSAQPATDQETAVFVRKMLEFAKAFQIPTAEAQAAVSFYREALADLSVDLLETAHRRIVRDWKWNKLPKPADIREMIDPEIRTRHAAITRIENAIKFGVEHVQAPHQNEAHGPKGENVNLIDAYKKLGLEVPDKPSWLDIAMHEPEKDD